MSTHSNQHPILTPILRSPVRCTRETFFDVIEFWVDNRIMIELLTTEMATQYLQFTTYPKTKKMFTAELVVAKV